MNESGRRPIFTPGMILGMIFGAVLLALLVNSVYAPFNPCPKGKCTTIHLDGCKIWAEVDSEDIKKKFQRLYTEVGVVKQELVMDRKGMGCVEAVYIFYKPLPPVMDSITHPRK